MLSVDLCVIGSGPGGQKAAIQAAKLGKSVAIVERMDVVGGVAINTGTIPSTALREAVMAVTGAHQLVPRAESSQTQQYALSELLAACNRVIAAEVNLVRSHFASNNIQVLSGTGSLVDANTVQVSGQRGVETLRATHILIATGTSPSRPGSIPFDSTDVITSDEILKLPRLPKSLIVVGGGVIGTEYASMMAALGVRTTIIEGKNRLLDFVDAEIGEALQYHLRQSGCSLRLGEKVATIRKVPAPPNARTTDGTIVEAVLESGKSLLADCLLYAVGRQGATASLNLPAAGLDADNRGRIIVNEHYQTKVPNIYAVGDVIGFPALASTSMEQGRIAALHMYGQRHEAYAELIPYGIYSVPEISMVGWTEERLTAEGIPFESGIAQYKEVARGQLLGDTTGMLKLLIHQDSHAILGAHCIGTNATELVHIAQTAMAFKGTVEYFINTVFNYPTLAECYKIAALNGLNKLAAT
ncbi:MAG: Si-specific NAD(P)(+) transhydrogenase [Phycisphaerales bacterium]|nr:Si-specific NAD(P)(+) transhydrogenase [Phycisphaerales bacterium]